MTRKKLTVVQMLPELSSGGVEEDTLEMAAFLASQGHRSVVVSAGGPLVERLVRDGSRHVRMPVGDKNPRLLSCVGPLRRLLTGFNADILHLRSRVPAWVGFAAAKSLAQNRRPAIVTTFHGTYSVHFFSGIMTRGERVVAITRFIEDHIRENYGVTPPRVVLIPGGYDQDRFDESLVDHQRVQDLMQNWGLAASVPPVIMLPARFTGWKGHRLLFEALSLLKNLDWLAVCVGDPAENPGYTQELEKLLVDYQIASRVVFAGKTNDMPAAYLSADVVVSASTEPEAFGRVAVEAQAMGRPVVATAHGGSLETIEDGKTGFLVEPGNPAAMARALFRLLADEAMRKEMGRNAALWAQKNFTTRSMCQRNLDMYYGLLREKGRLP